MISHRHRKCGILCLCKKNVFYKSEFVELVNLDFGKYKNVSHYGFNAVCKEKQYDWVCYMVTFGSVYN